MADKFRYSFDLTKEFEEQLKQGMLAAEQRDVTSSPGMMSADPPAQRLEEADQSKYDPYSFIKDYKDMLFSMFGGEEEYNKVIAEQDARLPKEEDALKKATGTYIGIIDLPPLPRVDTEKLEPYDKGEQPDVRKDVEETLQSIQIEETLNEVEKETSQQGLMSPRLDEGDGILPPPSVFIRSKGSSAGEAEREIYKDAYQSGLRGDELKAFMAQVAHESSSFSRTREGRYTYKGARNQPGWAARMDAAGLTSSATGDEIFNAVYANINGNGDYESGDGSRYAGRGYIQLTGKDNYRIIGEDIGEDLVGNPDLMLDPVIARKASIAWWKRNVRGNVPNDDYTDVRSVSGLVNRGRADRTASGLDDRRKLFNTYNQEKVPKVRLSLRPRSRPEEDELDVASN